MPAVQAEGHPLLGVHSRLQLNTFILCCSTLKRAEQKAPIYQNREGEEELSHGSLPGK